MRPLRLELHGFTAFRDAVVVDFTGADLFALSGPTGAGKSSIIDGMCFALYGSVPRLDRRTVAPVISTGKVEARIRFDFTVGDREFSAVRVVRRTANGATTKEARLEHDGETLAGDADGMTARVEQLLGLGFEQFTKSVVLPQGDFARFLHDKPSGRQELLVKLLELGVYERMRGDANSRHAAAQGAAEQLGRQLDDMADVTPDALAAATARVEQLTALREEIDQTQPQLDELQRRGLEAQRLATEAEASVGVLSALRVPSGVADLSRECDEAEAAAHAAVAAAEAADAAVAAAEKDREGAGDAAALQRLQEDHATRITLGERIDRGTQVVAEKRRQEQDASAALTRAETAAAEAAAAVMAAEREHAAHAVAATLVAGEPCPVCLQTVDRVPDRPLPAAVEGAAAARATAERARTAADKAARAAEAERSKVEQHLALLTEQLEHVDERLQDAAPAERIASQLSEITRLDAALVAARQKAGAARAAATAARKAADQARGRRDGAWREFDAARDSLAALGAPAPDRADLSQAWTALAAWAAAEAERRRAAAEASRATAVQSTDELAALHGKLSARCDECEVAVGPGARPRDAVGDAVTRAEHEQRRIEHGLQQAARLRDELAGQQTRAAVAKTLVGHLSARGFEQWLLDEATGRLADGASGVLRELSSGQYSLTLDGQRNFVVIDHRSADEQRPARTLSGGETFLASLSLALTLAEHLTQLAVGAAPRLESIFLDEGFGTLDAETLDVVAAAIEELGARGRTVGIVTHVRDLADRMPVRYDVRKGPAGSVVERVDR